MARQAARSAPALLVAPTPTIKGIFVNSHVEAVRKAKGPEGMLQLERAFGAPIEFRDLDDVPVRDEVRIIEFANDLLSVDPVPPAQRAYLGGRLHYTNFSGTPIARMMFGIFPRNFRYLVLHAGTIAERVFKGVLFETAEHGPKAIEVVMRNNDYPMDHFRGFFQAWMDDFGYHGTVEAQELPDGAYRYAMRWT